MKNCLTTIFLCALGFFSYAQPLLTRAVHQPQVGDEVIFTYQDTVGLNQGPAGQNVTWDFSQLTPISFVDTVKYSTVQAPYSNDSVFGTADLMTSHREFVMGFNIPVHEFLITDPDSTAYLGFDRENVADAGPAVNTNPGILQAYPMSYGDTLSNYFKGLYHGFGLFSYDGHTTLEIDGTGTLKLPTGTYSNIFRLHEHDISGNPNKHKPYEQAYYWFDANTRFPLLMMRMGPSYMTIAVSDESVQTGRQDEVQTSWEIFPQPADQSFKVLFSNDPGVKAHMRILDVQGKTIKEKTLDQVDQNGGATVIQISNLAPGLYFVALELNGAVQSTKKLLIRR